MSYDMVWEITLRYYEKTKDEIFRQKFIKLCSKNKAFYTNKIDSKILATKEMIKLLKTI